MTDHGWNGGTSAAAGDDDATASGPAAAYVGEPASTDNLEEVIEGLSKAQKELPSKYFYDHTGSELFEDITQLPEYYLTRTEEALLDRDVPNWVEDLAPGTLVELGAGSARKTRALLDAMSRTGSGRLFVPIDVSGDFLDTTVRQVRTEYPDLDVLPVVGDITGTLEIDGSLPAPVLFVLLGSTIGNFPGETGIGLLRGVRDVMGPDDRLLIGVDLRPNDSKSVEDIEAAYNDAAGVTAAFNLNLLNVLNQALGTDFDPGAYEHRAHYDVERSRIEMHLVSTLEQDVTVGARVFHLDAGETIRSEISCKYDRAAVATLLESADMALDRWTVDPRERFAMAWAAPVTGARPGG